MSQALQENASIVLQALLSEVVIIYLSNIYSIATTMYNWIKIVFFNIVHANMH